VLLSPFLRDDDRVFETYRPTDRGVVAGRPVGQHQPRVNLPRARVDTFGMLCGVIFVRSYRIFPRVSITSIKAHTEVF
jgi:hypothetical protein